MWWRLLWWVITTALTDLLTKVPPDAVAAGLGDFNIPTATEGRVVPIILGGQIRCNSPNCIWYGDYAAIERIQTTGVIIKKDNVIGYTYELALAYALFKGECAGITGIWIGDEKVFDYVTDASSIPQTVVDVDADDIYGGKNQGGGFVGRFRLFNGAEDQPVSAFMSSRITEGVPAYRGTSYVMVTDIAETKGAEIGEAPNLRHVNIEVQVFDTVANGALGDALALGNDHHFIGKDANPISVAYDLFRNERWGRGLPESDIDRPSFVAAAETIWTEGIGFTMLVDEFTNTESIQDNIEQHIDGYIGPNAVTGKFEVKLARQDYTLAAEFQANDSNIVDVPSWNKGDWSQTFNRVRMRYADRNKDWNETHAVANAPANRIIQGRLVSQEVRYPGVHDATVANKIVSREKKNLSRPARSGSVELNREAWQLRPGEVFSLTSTLAQETNLPVRITKTEIGDPIKNTLICEVLEDIFDNETSTVADPPDTDFVPPTQDVDPFLVADQWAIEAPYMIIRQDPISPNVSPRLLTGARISTGAPTEYEVQHRLPGGSGSYASVDFIGGGLMQAGVLRNSELGWVSGNGGKSMQIDPIAGSLDNLINPYSPGTLNMQGVAVINPGATNEEWVIFESAVDDLGGIRLEGLYRGGFDSAQETHTAGERIWFIWTGGVGLPSFQYTVGDTPDIKLLPRSPTDAVAEPDATAIALVPFMTAESRNDRPLLPSQLVINGTDFSNTMNFDTVISGTPETVGGGIAPRLRDWRNQDPLDQVQGGGIRGDIWGDDEHQVQYWLYNLETDPTPGRGDAVVNKTVSATFATDGGITVLRDEVSAEFIAADKNALAMRIEVETSHIKGFGASRYPSREVILHDFTGTGIFVVPYDAVFVQLDFENGVTGTRVVDDRSANLHQIDCVNTDTGINTSVSAPIGTRAFRFGDNNTDTSPINTGGYLRLPSTGDVSGDLDFNQDWTVEWRMRSDADPFSDEAICGHGAGSSSSNPRWGIWYMEDELYFRFTYALTGGSLNQVINMVEATGWTPTPDTWYAYMLTRQVQPDGTITLRLFRDGVKVSTQNRAAFTINTNTPAPDLSIGAADIDRSVVSGATSDGMEGYMDEFRIIQGAAVELIDYTVPTVTPAAAANEYLIALTNFDGEAGTDSAKLAEDFASTDTLWVYDGTQAQCRIAGDKSKFGNTSLFVNGTQDAGLRWGNFETIAQIGHQYLLNHDFTIEGWVNYTALPSTTTDGMALCGRGDNGGNEREYFFGVDENDELEFSYWDHNVEATEVNIKATTTPTVVADTWYHLAVCRNGSAIEAWFNGTRVLNDATFFEDGSSNPVTFNAGETTSGGAICVGKAFRDESGGLHRSMNGHIDSFRAIKREALYTGATITVPTEKFPNPHRAPAGVRIPTQANIHYHNHFNMEDATYDPHWRDVMSLLHFEGTDLDTTTTDDGSFAPTWTFNGNAQIDTAQSAFGSSSCLFDGTGDYLTAPDANDWHEIGAGEFCIDAQVRWATDPTGTQQCIIGKWGTSPGFCWKLWHDSDDHLAFNYSTNGSTNTHVSAAFNFAVDTWYHVAVCSDGLDIGLYVDGVQIGSFTNNITAFDNHTSLVSIGATTESGSEDYFDGWIDEVRVTSGSKRYICQAAAYDYTPQGAAWSHKYGYEFPQDQSDNNWALNSVTGTPLIDTATKKFGTSSLYLDGSSHIKLFDSGPVFDALNFVIEAQVMFDGDPLTGNMTIASEWDTNGNQRGWILALRNNELVFQWDDSFATFSTVGTWNPATATWYHVMVSKVQGYTRLFIDGTQVGTGFEATSASRFLQNPNNPRTTIGAHHVATVPTDLLTGWVDEFRIVITTNSIRNTVQFPTADFTAPADEYDYHRILNQPAMDNDVVHMGLPFDASNLGGTLTLNQKIVVGAVHGIPHKFTEVTEERGGGNALTMFDDGGGTPYVAIGHNDAFQLHNHDFTLEGWFRHDTDPKVTSQFYASAAEVGEREVWGWWYDASKDAVEFFWSPDGLTASRKRIYADWSGVAINTWYHVAVTREGDTIRHFFDGVLQTNNVSSDTMTADEELFVATDPVGWFIWDADFAASNPSLYLRGAGFDMRWTKKALYTATFTPPSQFLPRFGECIPSDF